MDTILRRTFRFIVFALLVFLSAGATTEIPARVAHEDVETFASCEVTNATFITWFPKEFECPVCKTKNTFMVVGSYGSYIYADPSKYQLIFWPYTDTPSWYSCKKCRLSIFMEDFEQIPPDKIADLRKMLETTSLPAQTERPPKSGRLMSDPPYLEIPTALRVSVAEKVYQVLGKTGDEFWNHFYRVLAYHYDRQGKTAEAEQARRKSIAITEKLLTPKSPGTRKELLYILGAMRHFVGEDTAALKALEEAGTLTYKNDELPAERNTNYDEYLSKAIKEYVEMLKKGEGPRGNKSLRSTSH
ncbi:MAG TPA: tetratricopeptide repeat protein [Pyrinomonadaceae bacterium]